MRQVSNHLNHGKVMRCNGTLQICAVARNVMYSLILSRAIDSQTASFRKTLVVRCSNMITGMFYEK